MLHSTTESVYTTTRSKLEHLMLSRETELTYSVKEEGQYDGSSASKVKRVSVLPCFPRKQFISRAPEWLTARAASR